MAFQLQKQHQGANPDNSWKFMRRSRLYSSIPNEDDDPMISIAWSPAGQGNEFLSTGEFNERKRVDFEVGRSLAMTLVRSSSYFN
jgi:hypothetical protein